LKLRYGRRGVRVEWREDDQPATRDFQLETLGRDPDFIDLLRSREVQTIHTLEATMEDIFIKVTGRRLE
jgi:fluoroquinolone transport system ATP-binding protein